MRSKPRGIRRRTGIVTTLILFTSPALLVAQTGGVFCVTSRDTSWKPTNFGWLESENSLRTRRGVVSHAYPILHRIVPGSPADSAGIRDGDVLRAINGFDLAMRHDSARVHGPGVATRFRIARGDSTFERTLVGLPVKPCPDSLKRRAGR
jgi:hypothetical protein